MKESSEKTTKLQGLTFWQRVFGSNSAKNEDGEVLRAVVGYILENHEKVKSITTSYNATKWWDILGWTKLILDSLTLIIKKPSILTFVGDYMLGLVDINPKKYLADQRNWDFIEKNKDKLPGFVKTFENEISNILKKYTYIKVDAQGNALGSPVKLLDIYQLATIVKENFAQLKPIFIRYQEINKIDLQISKTRNAENIKNLKNQNSANYREITKLALKLITSNQEIQQYCKLNNEALTSLAKYFILQDQSFRNKPEMRNFISIFKIDENTLDGISAFLKHNGNLCQPLAEEYIKEDWLGLAYQLANIAEVNKDFRKYFVSSIHEQNSGLLSQVSDFIKAKIDAYNIEVDHNPIINGVVTLFPIDDTLCEANLNVIMKIIRSLQEERIGAIFTNLNAIIIQNPDFEVVLKQVLGAFDIKLLLGKLIKPEPLEAIDAIYSLINKDALKYEDLVAITNNVAAILEDEELCGEISNQSMALVQVLNNCYDLAVQAKDSKINNHPIESLALIRMLSQAGKIPGSEKRLDKELMGLWGYLLRRPERIKSLIHEYGKPWKGSQGRDTLYNYYFAMVVVKASEIICRDEELCQYLKNNADNIQLLLQNLAKENQEYMAGLKQWSGFDSSLLGGLAILLKNLDKVNSIAQLLYVEGDRKNAVKELSDFVKENRDFARFIKNHNSAIVALIERVIQFNPSFLQGFAAPNEDVLKNIVVEFASGSHKSLLLELPKQPVVTTKYLIQSTEVTNEMVTNVSKYMARTSPFDILMLNIREAMHATGNIDLFWGITKYVESRIHEADQQEMLQEMLLKREIKDLYVRGNFDNYLIEGFKISKCRLDNCSFNKSIFNDCQFEQISLANFISFEGAIFDARSLQSLINALEAQQDKFSLKGIKLIGSFENFNFKKVSLEEADFTAITSLKNADMNHCNLCLVKLHDNQLCNVNLYKAFSDLPNFRKLKQENLLQRLKAKIYYDGGDQVINAAEVLLQDTINNAIAEVTPEFQINLLDILDEEYQRLKKLDTEEIGNFVNNAIIRHLSDELSKKLFGSNWKEKPERDLIFKLMDEVRTSNTLDYNFLLENSDQLVGNLTYSVTGSLQESDGVARILYDASDYTTLGIISGDICISNSRAKLTSLKGQIDEFVKQFVVFQGKTQEEQKVATEIAAEICHKLSYHSGTVNNDKVKEHFIDAYQLFEVKYPELKDKINLNQVTALVGHKDDEHSIAKLYQQLGLNNTQLKYAVVNALEMFALNPYEGIMAENTNARAVIQQAVISQPQNKQRFAEFIASEVAVKLFGKEAWGVRREDSNRIKKHFTAEYINFVENEPGLAKYVNINNKDLLIKMLTDLDYENYRYACSLSTCHRISKRVHGKNGLQLTEEDINIALSQGQIIKILKDFAEQQKQQQLVVPVVLEIADDLGNREVARAASISGGLRRRRVRTGGPQYTAESVAPKLQKIAENIGQAVANNVFGKDQVAETTLITEHVKNILNSIDENLATCRVHLRNIMACFYLNESNYLNKDAINELVGDYKKAGTLANIYYGSTKYSGFGLGYLSGSVTINKQSLNDDFLFVKVSKSLKEYANQNAYPNISHDQGRGR